MARAEPLAVKSTSENHESRVAAHDQPTLPAVGPVLNASHIIQTFKYVPQLDKDELLRLVEKWAKVESSGEEFSHLYRACEAFGRPAPQAEYYLIDGSRKAYVGKGGEVVIHVAIEASLEDPLIQHARQELVEFLQILKSKGKGAAEKAKVLEGACAAAGLYLPLEWRFKDTIVQGLTPRFLEITPWMRAFMGEGFFSTNEMHK